MEEDFTCKTCGYVENGVFAKRVAREWGDNIDSVPPDPKAKTCGIYNGAPDPKTHEYFTKPECVRNGAECPHWISEEEAKTRHIPNYCLP